MNKTEELAPEILEWLEKKSSMVGRENTLETRLNQWIEKIDVLQKEAEDLDAQITQFDIEEVLENLKQDEEKFNERVKFLEGKIEKKRQEAEELRETVRKKKTLLKTVEKLKGMPKNSPQFPQVTK